MKFVGITKLSLHQFFMFFRDPNIFWSCSVRMFAYSEEYGNNLYYPISILKFVGIIKLSLHQFFMSFRDPKISAALLKSQYPVIAVDNYLPVVNPISGQQYGQLKVLLAMGSDQQVNKSCI